MKGMLPSFPKHRRARGRGLIPTGWVVLPLLFLLTPPSITSVAQAHVVPPETFHPVAESYRRLTFFLNLNPVPWDLVADDVGVISTHLSVIDPAATDRFGTSVKPDLAAFAGRGDSGPPDSRESRAAAGSRSPLRHDLLWPSAHTLILSQEI